MTDAARGECTPPTPQEADRHAAYALDLVEYMETGNRKDAAALLQRLHRDPTVDPWALVLGAAELAGRRRRCTRPHART